MVVSGIHEDTPVTTTNSRSNSLSREMYYIKGSIEAILEKCKFYYVNEESTPALDSNTWNVIMTRANAAASRGLRVLAMAYGYGSANPSGIQTPMSSSGTLLTAMNGTPPLSGVIEKNNLVFVGFQAMLDPSRRGVADSIGLLQAGGVQVVMIKMQRLPPSLSPNSLACVLDRPAGGVSSSHCLTGQAIDQMTKGQLKERVGNVSVLQGRHRSIRWRSLRRSKPEGRSLQ
jgi:Ca2+-transporting ATPase